MKLHLPVLPNMRLALGGGRTARRTSGYTMSEIIIVIIVLGLMVSCVI